ncbi:tetratricopeptide repeat protein, partial [Enterococcus casseliflavus]|uniref:tetratricopeptide repeat protein n=1 Tax=Enterococcus casseliflavus TaxID=37734 RepID=UPI003D140B5B
LGDLAGAESSLREAWSLSHGTLGEDHDESAGCALSLGGCLYARGRDREAVEALRAALKSFEAARRRVSPSPLETVDFAAQRSPHLF